MQWIRTLVEPVQGMVQWWLKTFSVAHKAVKATVAELHKTLYFSGMYRWVSGAVKLDK
jgi:hypothetical protein